MADTTTPPPKFAVDLDPCLRWNVGLPDPPSFCGPIRPPELPTRIRAVFLAASAAGSGVLAPDPVFGVPGVSGPPGVDDAPESAADEVSEPEPASSSAQACPAPYPVATAAPMPRATASVPTRPM
ncbi:hypothetical protein MPHLEI_15496 [Mycolicibacterium phlei RIVM601174]|nr:hypothetical protein MPHLEI_15496 [Mycolicibacterium phlei RIVM601174]MBF4192531.1 hypothetical protein [Mycolicibacterium phlei]MDA4084195.1 hypothetical protein [Mycolicibacterium hassiacum DSM 44199]